MKDDNKKEKVQRVTFVIGIFTASVMGFVINLYTSIYYDVFLIQKTTLTDYSQSAIIFPSVVFVFAIALLTFLVYDYQNELNLDRSFLRRFMDYYCDVFWLSRMAQKMSKALITFFKWFFAILITLSIYQSSGLRPMMVWLSLVILWIMARYIYRKMK